jgi:hypothetical protein
MTPLRALPIAVAALAVIAGAFVLANRGESSPPPPAPPPAAQAGAPAHLTSSRAVRIGATSQFDLGSGTPLRVGLRVPGGGAWRVVAAVAGPSGRAYRLAAARRVAAGRVQRVQIPVRSALRGLLHRCVPYRLDVTLQGPRRLRSQRLVAPAPPWCGRYFGPHSVWNAPIPAGAGVDAKSATYVNTLVQQVQAGFQRNFPPTINTTSYSAPIYTVPATQKRVRVRLAGSRARYGSRLQAELNRVPMPPVAKPAAGADAHLVVWQPATDTMWELWHAAKRGAGWVAAWGGRLVHVSRSRGYFYDSSGIQPGATATSLPLAGGLVTLADLRAGRIDHALAMAIPASRASVWAFPAQRTDGNVRSADAIPAGARFRIDPSVNIDSLHLPRFTAMLARAAQQYGIYVRDTSPVVTLYAEDPQATRSNPWPAAFGGSPSALLRRFPWDKLQVMQTQLRTYGGKHVSG